MLSVCITCLNDNKELGHTVQSILDTTHGNAEIIVIDDASDQPVHGLHKSVKLRRNPKRIGVAESRCLAARIATQEHILLTDSHMRFEDGWYENIKTKLDPNTAWCGTCLGLHDGNMDIRKYKGEYNGARMVFFEPVDNKPPTIMEGKWIPPTLKDGSDVQCFMGACYFIPRTVFNNIGGLRGLKQWGSDEPYLSLKLWLAGVDIKMAKDVRIGHMFRKQAPYKTMTWSLIYNKLRIFQELFDHETYKFIRSQFIQSPPLMGAVSNIMKDAAQIDLARQRYSGIFKRDIKWYCERFKVKHPLDYVRLCKSSEAFGIRGIADRFVSPRLRPRPHAGGTPDLVGAGV